MGKYWICDGCAVERKWTPFKTGNTLSMGLCSWCESNKETMLTPLRDLKDGKGKRADCTPEGQYE